MELNAKPIMEKQYKTMDLTKIHTLLKNFNEIDKTHVQRIHQPKGGQVFIFFSNDKNRANDYKVDGYNWRHIGGSKPTPIKDPILFRCYYNVALSNNMNSDEFKKIVYHHYDPLTKSAIEQPILIHYLGATEIDKLKSFEPKAHGNLKDKDNGSSYQLTLPSVINDLKSELKTQLPIEVHRRK